MVGFFKPVDTETMMQPTSEQNLCLYCQAPVSCPVMRYCCEACERLHRGFEQLSTYNLKDRNAFQFLDEVDIQKHYAQSETQNKFLFYVEGIQCSSCVHLLEKIPDYNSDCLSAVANVGTSTLAVELKPGARLSVIADLIEHLGYKATPLKFKDNYTQKIQKENRADLKRIAVAGACAGNIMIFSFSLYAGATGEIAEIFKWLNLVLFLPVVFYSAVPFYKGAWSALKTRSLHIDLPIVIALTTSVIFSIFNLVRGSDLFYFDSTAGFLFLILVARYFVKKTQQHFLAPFQIHETIQDQTYETIDGRRLIPEMIQKGDQLKIYKGQTVPADCYLQSPQALIDTSFFNGESIPQVYTSDLKLFAGYKLLQGEVLVLCSESAQDSRMHQLMNSATQNLAEKNNYIQLTDQLARNLILTVFIVSGLFLFGYGVLVSFTEALNRVLALIVVACPCALAFGSPLTFAVAFKKARSQGIAFKNSNVFEKIDSVRHVFFDKTGTLTSGHLKLDYTWPEQISAKTKNIILNLEKISYHPIAFALRDVWSYALHTLPVQNHEEILGQGVRGQIHGETYELKKLSESIHESDYGVVLLRNKEPVCRLYFNDPLREESSDIVRKLEKLNIKSFILTGDRKKKAFEVAEACAIPKQNVFAELYPEEKANIIENYPDAAMIGDGFNDALALSKAHVGIAMKGSAQLTLLSSDVYFLRGGLTPFYDLLKLRDQTHQTLKRNIFLSLTYNLIAGGCALAGLVNPLLAAILMPISTGLVVLSSLWGFRE